MTVLLTLQGAVPSDADPDAKVDEDELDQREVRAQQAPAEEVLAQPLERLEGLAHLQRQRLHQPCTPMAVSTFLTDTRVARDFTPDAKLLERAAVLTLTRP